MCGRQDAYLGAMASTLGGTSDGDTVTSTAGEPGTTVAALDAGALAQLAHGDAARLGWAGVFLTRAPSDCADGEAMDCVSSSDAKPKVEMVRSLR